MELTKEQGELLDRIHEDTSIDARYMVENDMPENLDDFMEKLDEAVNEIEVIYYASAMNFLRENDPSLRESLELAHDYGFDIKNLNSEILATILQQSYAREDLGEFRDEIEELFFAN